MMPLSIKTTRSLLPNLKRIIDGAIAATTLWASQVLLEQPVHSDTWTAGLLAGVLYYLVGETIGLYQSTRSRSPDHEVMSILAAWSVSLITLSGIGFLIRATDSFSRSSIVVWYMLGGLFLMFVSMQFRIVLGWFSHHGVGIRRTAIAGLNPLGIRVAQKALESPESGFRIDGFYDDRELHRLTEVPEDINGFKGDIDTLLARAKQGEIDTVLVTLPMRAEDRIKAIMSELADSTVSVYIVPDFFVFELLHSRWNHVGDLPVISVFESPVYGVDGILKRIVDIVLAAIGIVILLPVLIICGLLVKLSGPGPVFFRQKRYGLDGHEILVWKFRSMRTCDNGAIVKQATRDDPRVTPIGKLMRKTSLDELPQLFNVIAGNMSLVGPRPHATAHNEHFRKLIRGYMLRHKVKPGITGLAQVEGSRGETETVEKMQERIDFDHRYIREWSFWLDAKIIFKTFWVVFHKEAY